MVLISGSGRCPGEGNGNPPQYSCQKLPWTVVPSMLEPMGPQRIRYDWSDWAHTGTINSLSFGKNSVVWWEISIVINENLKGNKRHGALYLKFFFLTEIRSILISQLWGEMSHHIFSFPLIIFSCPRKALQKCFHLPVWTVSGDFVWMILGLKFPLKPDLWTFSPLDALGLGDFMETLNRSFLHGVSYLANWVVKPTSLPSFQEFIWKGQRKACCETTFHSRP